LGWIPKEWDVVRCAEICREIVVGIVIQPAQYYCSEGVPVLRSGNVRETGIDGSDLVYMSHESNRLLAKSMLRSGDVVTVRTGYPGTSCVVSADYDGSNCVDIIISRPGPRTRSEFLAIWINSDSGRNQVLQKQGGLAQQHFNVGELKDLLVALPSSVEQKSIESVLLSQQASIHGEELHRNNLQLLKLGLMQDLLTGKVRVKVEEAQEVACV
jgi:type I restriction enzyme S subunit